MPPKLSTHSCALHALQPLPHKVFLSLYETIPAQPFTVVEKLSSAVPSAQAVVFGVPEEEVVKPEELDEEPPEELEKDEDDELEDELLDEELLEEAII